MFRPLPFIFGLIMGLTAFAGWAESLHTKLPVSETTIVCSTGSTETASRLNSDRIAAAGPDSETALFQLETGSITWLADSTLIADQPAQSQTYLAEITHQRWCRFARLPVAPFSNCRSLPLLR